MAQQYPYIQAPFGIIIHFLEGVHVVFPPGERKFHLRIVSLDNGQAVFDRDVQETPERPVEFKSLQTYCVNWEVVILQDKQIVFRYALNLTGRPVCINMLPGAMGDMVAWMPAVAHFQHEYNPKLTVLMKREYIELFESVYPQFRFVSPDTFRVRDYYACYPVGVWGYGDLNHNPTDFQKDNLIDHADNILRVHSNRQPPLIAAATEDCKAKYGKYVCIATRASRKMKQWNYPGGWEKVVDFLKGKGYRVFCIDGDNQAMPPNAEDFTGYLPLRQRVNLLRGAEFFVGLPSGLSWIAWACEKPVVMIANCTEEWVEFETPYRISNKEVCHGCFNSEDMRFNEFDKCPCNKDFICTTSISAEKVIETIQKVPCVKETK